MPSSVINEQTPNLAAFEDMMHLMCRYPDRISGFYVAGRDGLVCGCFAFFAVQSQRSKYRLKNTWPAEDSSEICHSAKIRLNLVGEQAAEFFGDMGVTLNYPPPFVTRLEWAKILMFTFLKNLERDKLIKRRRYQYR